MSRLTGQRLRDALAASIGRRGRAVATVIAVFVVIGKVAELVAS